MSKSLEPAIEFWRPQCRGINCNWSKLRPRPNKRNLTHLVTQQLDFSSSLPISSLLCSPDRRAEQALQHTIITSSPRRSQSALRRPFLSPLANRCNVAYRPPRHHVRPEVLDDQARRARPVTRRAIVLLSDRSRLLFPTGNLRARDARVNMRRPS